MPTEKKPAPKPEHPPFKKMVGDAILELKDRKGSTGKAIAKAIVDKYGKKIKGGVTGVDKLISTQLKRLVQSGYLDKPNNARFKLSETGKKEAHKKPKAPKAKKPAADAPPATKKPVKKPAAAAAKKTAVEKKTKPTTKKVAAKPKAASKPKKPAAKKAPASAKKPSSAAKKTKKTAKAE